MLERYKYLIVGGGMSAAAAIESIREADSTGAIGLVGAEADPPYDRPPLSKALWKGRSEDVIWRKLEVERLKLHLGRRATAIDVRNHLVKDDRQAAYGFDKLLLATGGRPRRLAFGGDDIIYFRSLPDYRRLRALAGCKPRFAVIGGGFIGSEVAAALAMNGREVVLIFPEDRIGGRVFPVDLGLFLNEYFRQKGIEVRPNETAVGSRRERDRLILKTSTGSETGVDGVVAGVGLEPNAELAEKAGLTVADGIVVNEFLQTSHPDIYAAGDVAAFHNSALGKWLRVEHEDNANTMGRLAGRNMAGQAAPYRHMPFFYSDLFELGYEAVGELDARMETVADWKTPFQEGVVYYLRTGRVCGVLLWNVWNQVDAARALIAEPGPLRREDLMGMLPKGG